MNVCYGCADTHRTALGAPGSGRVGTDPVFTDSRTGRSFCAECVLALLTWELDGCPEADEMPYPAWIDTRLGGIGSGDQCPECDSPHRWGERCATTTPAPSGPQPKGTPQ